MRNGVAAFIVGFIFALGLGLSGMTQPQKVVGFLDIFGNWDPTLAFVMVGAIIVHLIAYRVIVRRPRPLWSDKWHIPTRKEITPSLVMGSFLFGIGWGLAGYCPGPALTSIASFQMKPLIFVLSMVLGMYFFRFLKLKTFSR